MAYANGTLHYNLPQTVGTDVRDWSDTNQAFEDVDTALYGAVSDVATASSGVTALDTQLNAPTTGVVAQLGQAQSDIVGIDGRVQTLEGTVSNHTSQIADVRADCEDMICAFNETSSTSTHDYAIGDYFRYNDVLYEATAVINIGDTITPDTNCKTTNVTTELLDIKGATDKVGDLSTLTTTAKTNCVAAINEVNSAVGTLSSLTTTDKSSTVAAINELDSDLTIKTVTGTSLADLHTALAALTTNQIRECIIQMDTRVFPNTYCNAAESKYTFALTDVALSDTSTAGITRQIYDNAGTVTYKNYDKAINGTLTVTDESFTNWTLQYR